MIRWKKKTRKPKFKSRIKVYAKYCWSFLDAGGR